MDDHVYKERIEAELGIDEKNINEIFNCIVKGSIDDVRAKRNLFPSLTYNSKHNDIWDSINAKCAASFCDGYIVTMHKRGIYEFITILNMSSSCAYLLMKEKNFNKVISGPISDTHYMKCLTLINDDLKACPQIYGQMSLELPQSDKIKDKKEIIMSTIIEKINSSVNRFVVVSFEPDIITGVKAIYVNVVASDTSTKYRKDWTSAIKAVEIPENYESTYDNRDLDVDVANVATFDAPAEVKIKKKVQKEEYGN